MGLQMLLCRCGLFVVGLVLLSSGFAAQVGETFSGKVVGIADGDTISVMRNGRAERIRLDGIDCPEDHQDFSERASQFTSSKVFSKTVTVQVKDVDRYGRLVGRILIGTEDLSVALVQAGLAWHYLQYSNDPALARAEANARRAKRAIWSRPSPVPPWEFRRGGRSGQAVGSVDGALRGNRRSKIFHRPGCRNYDCKNCTVFFDTADEAVSAGYRAAGDCTHLQEGKK